ncbi:MAG TPA: hypothetical protein VHH88_04370 [Verrucomicrobiae bacterium]|nr:hypothetical protein [Verrucomicrobiae bacterium]
MNPDSDPGNPQQLLDEVLLDTEWREFASESESRALAAFRAHNRFRRVRAFALRCSITAVLLLAFLLLRWESKPEATALNGKSSFTARKGSSSNADLRAPAVVKNGAYITESQMLALFPKGSCAVAEVDGHKQLVFLNSQIRRNGWRPE